MLFRAFLREDVKTSDVVLVAIGSYWAVLAAVVLHPANRHEFLPSRRVSTCEKCQCEQPMNEPRCPECGGYLKLSFEPVEE
jgi:hypothetical protein